jgi:hypothetical protein
LLNPLKITYAVSEGKCNISGTTVAGKQIDRQYVHFCLTVQQEHPRSS